MLAVAALVVAVAQGTDTVPARRAPAPVAAMTIASPVDSGPALDFPAFYRQVLGAHPVVLQAELLARQARAEQGIARGAWDPVVTGFWDNKKFKGLGYYDEYEIKATVPTPWGVDIKAGFERAAGEIINPERATPQNGLVNLGVSIPLGQRIVTDERRNALRQATALRDAAEGDRQAIVNKLLLSAAKDYGRWYEAVRRRAIQRNGVALAEFRLRAVRERVRNGDAAPIDTIEARLEVQRRQVARLDAEVAAYQALLAVSSYLWDPQGAPIDPPADALPSLVGIAPLPVDSAALPRWLDRAEREHPDLLKARARVRAAEAQRLFTGQQILPFANLELNQLADAKLRDELGDLNRAEENYKATVTARTSLLFMRERNRFSQAGQRLEQQKLEVARLRRDIALDVRGAVNLLDVLGQQILLQRDAVERARALLVGEQRRFEAGESSLLVVNLRERGLLDEEVRLASLEGKYAAARAELAVAVGDPSVAAPASN